MGTGVDMDSREALLKEYTARYRRRITQGLATYGEFDPATDKRNMCREAQEEALDIGSYMEMLEQKRPDLKTKTRRILAKAVVLYGMLKKLEQEEGGGE